MLEKVIHLKDLIVRKQKLPSTEPILQKTGSPIEEARKLAREHPAFKEQWQVNFAGITISGESGTGKTTLAEFFGEIYHIPEERNIKIGQLMRKAQEKLEEEGYIDRPISLDKNVDDLQKQIIKHATLDNPFVLEGRRSGEFVHEEKQNNPELPVIAVQLIASLEKIRERVKKRNSHLSDQEIDQLLSNRAQLDHSQWAESSAKPIDEINPYDPKNFDLIVDTNDMDVNQAFDYIHNWLLEKGLIRRIGPKDLTEVVQIFPSQNL